MNSLSKTRIAPTPSGYLHIGNVFSFAITATIAKQRNLKVLLRIDDMDRERYDAAYVQDIFDTLRFLGMPWQEGPQDVADFEQHYSQVHRLPLYTAAFEKLRSEGRIFACTCSRKEMAIAGTTGCAGGCTGKQLPLDLPGASWRLKTTGNTDVVIQTAAGVSVKQLPEEMAGFVVRKKDGHPAYQLTSVVDDVHYGVDMIVRGQDLWTSTLAQLYLARELGLEKFANTCFVHHSLLTGTDGLKLSKSAGATSIQHMRKQGHTAAEVYALAGRMAGMRERASTWEELGAAMLRKMVAE